MIYVTLILAAIAGYIAFWAGVVSLTGLAGWKPLAARYPAPFWPEEGEGTRFSWQSGRVGLSNYNNALNGVATDEGLFLKPVAIFKYNHPPLFIPWEAMILVEPGWLGTVAITLEDGKALRLGGKLAREVQRIRDAQASRTAAPADAVPPLLDDLESDLLGPDGDTLRDEALNAGRWRRHRTG